MTGIISAIKACLNWGANNVEKMDAITSPSQEEVTAKKTSILVCAHCHEKLNNCFRSQIDHSKEIGVDVYAVSIVIAKEDSQITNLFSHHTMLIFEGFNANGKFWRKAHLMGPGSLNRIEIFQDCFSGHSNIGQVELTSEKYSIFALSRCKEYRQTWTVAKDKVEELFTQIMWEQQHPEATPFRFLGEKSLVAVTREFLDTRDPELLEVEKADPAKFKKLCLLVKDKELLESFGKWYSKNVGLVATFSKFYIVTASAALIIGGGMLTKTIQQSNVSEAFRIGQLYEKAVGRSIYLMGGALVGIVVDAVSKNKMYQGLVNEVENNNEQLRFIQDRAKVARATSQNCFNWARRILKAIDIDLPEKRLEVLITIPELYLPNEEKVKEVCSESE